MDKGGEQDDASSDATFDDDGAEGDAIVLLGECTDELGGSEYLARVHDTVAGAPPRVDLDLRDLADMASALVDGSITLSKTLRNPALMPKQVMLYRAFVRAVFAPD